MGKQSLFCGMSCVFLVVSYLDSCDHLSMPFHTIIVYSHIFTWVAPVVGCLKSRSAILDQVTTYQCLSHYYCVQPHIYLGCCGRMPKQQLPPQKLLLNIHHTPEELPSLQESTLGSEQVESSLSYPSVNQPMIPPRQSLRGKVKQNLLPVYLDK